MGYTEDEDMIRVDFFKSSGKWYCTEAVKWTGSYFVKNGDLIHEAFAKSLREHLKDGRLKEMTAICLEPYHEHAHPLMLKEGAWMK